MSLSRFIYEPFYSLSDFDRLFDEAFSARTNGNSGPGELVRQGDSASSKSLRPRYALSDSRLTLDADADAARQDGRP